MIRKAIAHDYSALMHIKHTLGLEVSYLDDLDYKVKMQKAGFLLKTPSYTPEEFQIDLDKIFLVYEDNGKAVGFIRIDEIQEIDRTAKAWWNMPEIQDAYFSLPHADIGGIAVLPEVANRGVATDLLNRAIDEIRNKNIPYLFSLVVVSPITNTPSILFHEKNGFQRLALVTEPDYFEYKQYQSIIYGKSLSNA